LTVATGPFERICVISRDSHSAAPREPNHHEELEEWGFRMKQRFTLLQG